MTLTIRPASPTDLDAIMNLWLTGNLAAHDYISAGFWHAHEAEVRQAMSASQLWVAEKNNTLLGFLGLVDDYIAGLFVDSKAQGQGVGGKLVTHLQATHERLTLAVYQKNTRAIRFYQHHGFILGNSQVDEATGEKEYLMTWEKN